MISQASVVRGTSVAIASVYRTAMLEYQYCMPKKISQSVTVTIPLSFRMFE